MSLDSIFADLASQQPGGKGAKKAVQHATSKSQVCYHLLVREVDREKVRKKLPRDLYINLLESTALIFKQICLDLCKSLLGLNLNLVLFIEVLSS